MLLESGIYIFSEPLLAIFCSCDEDISVVGFVASRLELRSALVAIVSELDRTVDKFHESCDPRPFGGTVV